MNYWQMEKIAEYHREDLVREAEEIQLANLAATQPYMYRPGIFTRTMFNIANWMIVTGKELRTRYENPCIECPQPRSGSFA